MTLFDTYKLYNEFSKVFGTESYKMCKILTPDKQVMHVIASTWVVRKSIVVNISKTDREVALPHLVCR